MHDNPIDQVLEKHVESGLEVSITLRDGSLVQGKVKDFDGYVVLFDGVPQTVVYRHAILKLAGARAVKAERPAPRPKVQAQKRPERRPPPKTASKDPAEGHGQLSPMGEEMLKWLKSQKGGG